MNEANNLQTPTQPPLVIADVSRCPSSIVYLEDCVQGLKRFADNHFDLAIVDPPYGIEINMNMGRKKGQKKRHTEKDWDNSIPEDIYFKELFRVSKNQIIWGGNYFADLLPASRCWLYWQKNMGGDFADGELAWTSFDKVLKQYTKRSETFDRIHPTQKPIQLYDWIILNYCADANLILDTHVGSGSSRIAAAKAGKQFIGFEIDPEYYEKQEKRFNDWNSQLRMF
jgi:site-specific DNA-methyltransferase (adenine-specific)